MRASKSLRRSLLMLTAVGIVSIASARADNTISDSSLDPDEALTVVYAVYGGNTGDKLASHYVNVTDKVLDLLKKSPAGFSVTEDAVVGKHGTDLCQSLLIVYNYEQKSYFYNIAEGGGTVSADTLKSWAKTHAKVHIGAPIDVAPGDSFHVVFAAYGLGDTFFNVTDIIRNLLYEQPDGFIVTDAAMGGDPHPGWVKCLIVIFDDPTGRHLYSMFNLGPKVSKAAILEAAKVSL